MRDEIETERVVEALIEEREYMRRLARAVCGEGLADDAVQQATVQALERPPRHDASLRGWLATVVRNASLQLVRSESRRSRRETLAARPEEDEPQPAEFERRQVAHSLVEAVDALREPYRTVLRHRFLDDLSAEEVAVQTGRPLDTVRSQQKRGLALLREDLDRRHLSREHWLPMLVPLAGLSIAGNRSAAGQPLAPLHHASRSLRGLTLAAGGLLAAALAVTLGLREGADDAPDAAAAALAGAPAVDRLANLETIPAPDGYRIPAADAAAEANLVAVRGSTVDAAGEPIAWASVFVDRSADEGFALPNAARVPDATSNADGDFELLLPRGPAVLWARSGQALASEFAIALEVGPTAPSPSALRMRLAPAQVLAARVVDLSGNPLGDLEVQIRRGSARSGLLDLEIERGATRLHDYPLTTVTNASGHFRALVSDGLIGRIAVYRGKSLLATALTSETLASGRVTVGELTPIEVSVGDNRGRPVAGPKVELFRSDQLEPIPAALDSECRGLIGVGATTSIFAIRATATSRQPSVRLLGSPPVDGVNFRLVRERSLPILVTANSDDGSVPVAGVLVATIDTIMYAELLACGFAASVALELATLGRGTTDANGRVEASRKTTGGVVAVITEPPPGVRRAVVALPIVKKPFEIPLYAPEDTVVLRGNARAPLDGRPVQQTEIRAVSFDGQSIRIGPWIPVDGPDGAFEYPAASGEALFFEARAPGCPRVRSAGGFRSPSQLHDETPPDDGTAYLLDLVLAPSSDRWIEISDAAGSPISGVSLQLLDGGAPVLVPTNGDLRTDRIFLDEQGRAQIRALPARTLQAKIHLPLLDAPIDRSLDPHDPESFSIKVDSLALCDQTRLEVRVAVPPPSEGERNGLAQPLDCVLKSEDGLMIAELHLESARAGLRRKVVWSTLEPDGLPRLKLPLHHREVASAVPAAVVEVDEAGLITVDMPIPPLTELRALLRLADRRIELAVPATPRGSRWSTQVDWTEGDD